MTDAIVQVAPNSTGEKIDGTELSVGGQTVFRQRTIIGDDSAAAGLAKVQNAQPGASDYGLTVRPAGDGNVVLNAAAVTSAATLWTADVSGYRSFQFQIAGTFTASIVIEGCSDNTNWNQLYYFSGNNTLAIAATVASFSSAQSGHGPIRTKYLRFRCSSFTSNTSSALTVVLRTYVEIPEVVNVLSANNLSVAPTAPAGSNGTTAFVKSAATTNATSVKASAGSILGGILVNNSAAVKFFKFYNKASAPTVGTDTPVATLGIPANGGNLCLSDDGYGNARFSTGIAYAITGAVTDADTTAVAANDVSGWLIYV